ncbi:MAG: NAD(P)/FAD-dependent oxidoreductase [Thermoanaerobaculia bacterium]|nr:NAD(P)/FAD-dependent oxidoreductase [Thermoanaerobaculia bacterium]
MTVSKVESTGAPGSTPPSFDVLVAGGGPAGSATATWLAREGLRVVLCEKEEFPRFHIGESLLPYSVPLLRDLGAWPLLREAGFQEKFGGEFLFEPGGSRFRIDFSEGIEPCRDRALHVRRTEFDRILLDHAASRGVEVRSGARVSRVLFEGDRAVGARIEDSSGARNLRSRAVIDATGRGTLIGRQLGLRDRDPALGQASLFAHYRGARMGLGRAGGDILVVRNPRIGGWYWMIPLEEETTSVGAVFSASAIRSLDVEDRGERLDALLDLSPEISHRLVGADRISPVRGAADFSYRLRRFGGAGWLAVGDAAAFLDPVFSSGVHLALASGRLASRRVLRSLGRNGTLGPGEVRAYERELGRALDRIRRWILGYYDPHFQTIFTHPDPPRFFESPVISFLAGRFFRWDLRTWIVDRLMHGLAGLLRTRERLRPGQPPEDG